MSLLLGCGGVSQPILTPTSAEETLAALPYEEAIHLFDYDASLAFAVDVESEGEVFENGVVYEVTPHTGAITDPDSWAPAYLVIPDGEGPFAAVLFFHWLGQPNGDRDEFLDEAKALAGRGVTSLLVSGTFPWRQRPRTAAADRAAIVAQVIQLRRAADFLLSQPGIDPERTAFVGHDYGAMHGAVLSGLDHRLHNYVFMTGLGTYSHWSLFAFNLQARVDIDEYETAMLAVDPALYTPHSAPAALLFQSALGDEFIPDQMAQRWFNEASPPKELIWYDEGHELGAQARADRLAWLTEHLQLSAP